MSYRPCAAKRSWQSQRGRSSLRSSISVMYDLKSKGRRRIVMRRASASVCAAEVVPGIADAPDVHDVAARRVQLEGDRLRLRGGLPEAVLQLRTADALPRQLPDRRMVRVAAEHQLFVPEAEVPFRGVFIDDVVPHLRLGEVAVRADESRLLVLVRAPAQPRALFLRQQLARLPVEVVVVVHPHFPFRLELHARGVVVAHQDDVEVPADDLQRRFRVIPVPGHVAEQDEFPAPQPTRVRQRRLQRLRIRMHVAHDRVFHLPVSSREFFTSFHLDPELEEVAVRLLTGKCGDLQRPQALPHTP